MDHVISAYTKVCHSADSTSAAFIRTCENDADFGYQAADIASGESFSVMSGSAAEALRERKAQE